MSPVVYNYMPLYAIDHFASLFHSLTYSNNLSPQKVRVEYSCGSVEYTTTCSTPNLHNVALSFRECRYLTVASS